MAIWPMDPHTMFEEKKFTLRPIALKNGVSGPTDGLYR